MRDAPKDKPDGIIALARETADAFGRLTMQHLRLARLEMRADLRTMGLQAGLIAVLAALGIVGYALMMAGVAMLLGGAPREGLPFLIIGGAHVAAAVIGILIAVARLRRLRLMNATAGEVNRSLTELSNGAAPAPSVASAVEESR